MSGTLNVVFVTEPNAWHVEPWLKICAGHPAVASVTLAHLADPAGETALLARRVLGDKLRSTHEDVAAALGAAANATLGIVTLEPWRTPAACAQLLSAGCHVIYEKPGATSVEALRALVTLAGQQHRHLMMALANRAQPHLGWARQAIASGQIGDVWSVDARMVVRDRLVLGFQEHGGGWLFSRERGGGGFLTFLGCHIIDAVAWLTAQPIAAIAGFTGKVHEHPLEVEDTAAFAFRLANGAFGSFLGGYNLPQDDFYSVAIYGSEGWLQTDWETSAVGAKAVRCYVRRGPDGAPMQWTETVASLPPERDMYWAFGDACFAAALGRAAPPVTAEEGLHMLQVIHAVYGASVSGVSQRLPVPDGALA